MKLELFIEMEQEINPDKEVERRKSRKCEYQIHNYLVWNQSYLRNYYSDLCEANVSSLMVDFCGRER